MSKKLYNGVRDIYRNYNQLYYQVLYAVKHPFRVLKNNGGLGAGEAGEPAGGIREELTEQEIFGFVKFMMKLHSAC